MPRYSPAVGPEAEYEPGSRRRVLRNLRGIRRKREMDRAEYDALVAAQEAYYHRIGPDTRFTAALMHLAWLGGLYQWPDATGR